MSDEYQEGAIKILADVFEELSKMAVQDAAKEALEIKEHTQAYIEIDMETLQKKIADKNIKRMIYNVKRHLISVGSAPRI